MRTKLLLLHRRCELGGRTITSDMLLSLSLRDVSPTFTDNHSQLDYNHLISLNQDMDLQRLTLMMYDRPTRNLDLATIG